ncbi:major facilitator superfamily domain-containing protein [Trichoderma breve]|uniref:Major facilitator superfamily domain-containing protein n=1 Tax=Trichoderma breve TaxID=2034170 RepID=A0A9W9BFS0_9HYPO|nr:major facilitator superfamily domain-containing protein [Trichoderma breve]KAJ4859560.1 major facilitator superfamily domain-containing protein [Trichoderma breve]
MFTGSNSSGTAMEDADDVERRIEISEKDGNNASDREEPIVLKEEEDANYQPAAAAPVGSPPPNGGLRAWLVVVGAWCTSFCSFGWINSVGVFQDYYQATILKDYSSSTVSWIPSLQIFFMMALGPIIGLIYDKYGPRWLIIGGTFLHVFGLMMTSISHDYYQILLSQGVCSAIGVSAIFQPALNSIATWFTTKRGAAYGLLATGSSLGGVIFPIMVSRLIDEVGFGWSMRISAFLILALLIVAILTVKTHNPPKFQPITVKRMVTPFTEFQFFCLAMGLLLFTFGLYTPINYISVEAAAAGMDPNLVLYLIPILNAGSLFGRVFSGYAGDKWGRYNVFVTVCYLAGIFVLGLWIPATSTAARIAFATLFGFFSGAYVALIAALVVQVSPPSEIGFRTGLVFLASSIGGLTTNPISGAILERPIGWLGPKIFAGVFCIAGTTFVLAARIHKTGWKLRAVF